MWATTGPGLGWSSSPCLAWCSSEACRTRGSASFERSRPMSSFCWGHNWDARGCGSPGVLTANLWSLEYWLMRLGSSPLISWASRNSAGWICSGTGRRELASLWTCRYFWSCEPVGWSFWLRSGGVSMPQCWITGSIRHGPAHFEWKSRYYIFNLKSTSISLCWRRSWWEGCRGRFSGSP